METPVEKGLSTIGTPTTAGTTETLETQEAEERQQHLGRRQKQRL
jgi:hypothetical protein